MQKNVVIAILSIILLVLVLATIGFGCSFKMENFEDIEVAEDTEVKKATPAVKEDTTKKSAEPSALTPKEKEMFENIKNGTLTDEDIQKFIAEGKLTEKMVEKFLEHVEAPALTVSKDTKKETAPAAKPPVVEEDFDIEGFSGSMYAQF